MKIKIAIALMLMIFCGSMAMGAEVPEYEAKIDSQIPGIKLSIDCVIQAPVSKEVLQKLAADVYKKFKGKKYKNVFIMWYLPHYKINNGAWGTTNYIDGNLTTSILALQGE